MVLALFFMALSSISFSLTLEPGVSLMQLETKSRTRPARVAAVRRRGMVREDVCLCDVTRKIVLTLRVRLARLNM